MLNEVDMNIYIYIYTYYISFGLSNELPIDCNNMFFLLHLEIVYIY